MDWVPMNDLARSAREHRDALMADLAAVIDSGWFLTGPRTTAFADELVTYLGVPHVMPVGNGTDALEIALRALMPEGRSAVLCAANAGGYGTVAARRARLRRHLRRRRRGDAQLRSTATSLRGSPMTSAS